MSDFLSHDYWHAARLVELQALSRMRWYVSVRCVQFILPQQWIQKPAHVVCPEAFMCTNSAVSQLGNVCLMHLRKQRV